MFKFRSESIRGYSDKVLAKQFLTECTIVSRIVALRGEKMAKAGSPKAFGIKTCMDDPECFREEILNMLYKEKLLKNTKVELKNSL